MLAGRKLLLADDSATIQKVIELTFADEGVRVVAFGNGDEALQNLEEVAPDVVLADVFMPGKTGYEVCEHIKQNEKLKHIPVMLLVGSFEPFDEAEARRVGADDILTKPFQSIRRLIDRVGSLVGGRPPQEEVPTAELPDADGTAGDEGRLGTDELAITTADTQPLPAEWQAMSEEHTQPAFAAATLGEKRMEPPAAETTPQPHMENDSLLDLGDFEPVDVSAGDEFVLDLDGEEPKSSDTESVAYDYPAPRAFVEPEIIPAVSPEVESYSYASEPEVKVPESYEHTFEMSPISEPETYAAEPQSFSTQEVEEAPVTVAPEPSSSVESHAAPQMTAGQLSPEMIDAIARRAVELMSDKVVREIAWEVVPDLAELLIKRQLEEKESQAK